MIGVAAAFGGGVALRQGLEDVHLPRVRANQTAPTFKLCVTVISAAVPALRPPGMMSMTRPRVHLTLGPVEKETELGDYVAADSGRQIVSSDCPWQFGDTLTFTATLKDVMGLGLKLRLRSHSDLFLGPVQFDMATDGDLGEACVDLRNRALPACIAQRVPKWGAPTWESAPILFPISYVRGAPRAPNHKLGDAVAHVALVFGLDVDPEEVLAAADAADPRRASRTDEEPQEAFAQRALRAIFGDRSAASRSLSEVSGYAPSSPGSALQDEAKPKESPKAEEASPAALDRTMTAAEHQAAQRRADQRAGPTASAPEPLQPPDLEPDGWVSRKGPDGRRYWHHLALGPAPWEEDGEPAPGGSGDGAKTPERLQASEDGHGAGEGPSRTCVEGRQGQAAPPSPGLPRSDRATSFGPIVSPNLPPDGWVSHKGPDGRAFWHHRALGPAPWEQGGAPHGTRARGDGATLLEQLHTISEDGRGPDMPEGRAARRARAARPEGRAAEAPVGQGPAYDRRVSFGPVVSPNLPPDGWVCRKAPDGRAFWHHRALGPAPWERVLGDILAPPA